MNNKKHKLGLCMLTALVVGNVVGSGILMMPATLAAIGSISLLAWLLTAVGAFLLALVFAKMSVLVPKTGGPYAYAQVGFGNFVGFQTAYIYWIMILLGNAAVAVSLVGYLQVFFPILSNHYYGTGAEIASIWLFTYINLAGVRSAGVTQIVTTILKFIPLLIVAIFGWHYFHPEYITHSFNVSHKSNFSAFSYAATLTMWSFIGLESATVPSGSVDNPKRNIPLATMLGTIVSMAIYLSCMLVLMGMFPNAVLAKSTSPFATAAGMVFGQWGEWIAAAGAVISCAGVLNGWTLMQGQIPMAAADDHLFPKIFAKRSKKDVPAQGLALSSLIVSASLLFTMNPNINEQFQLLIVTASITALLAYFYTAIAEIVLLSSTNQRLHKNIINIMTALGGAAYAFWAIFGSGEKMVFYMTMFVFSSVPLYAWMMWVKKKEGH
ncbi:MAG: amino acid permease [Gammaproteobacteria bacterium GWE2_37_16]|nr:MAG: amino acid permease [Gammaproteobacteria bacterium GWE2_37_16]